MPDPSCIPEIWEEVPEAGESMPSHIGVHSAVPSFGTGAITLSPGDCRCPVGPIRAAGAAAGQATQTRDSWVHRL